MIALTDIQTKLLFNVTEKHLEWYEMYYNNPPAFEILLELNHRKLSYKVTANMSEIAINELLESMLLNYEELIQYYGKDG